MHILSQRDDLHHPDASNPIFVGQVSKQDLVNEHVTESLRVTSVRFNNGARNKWHQHSTEQVLFVTSGRGIIATADGEREITPGDTIAIQPGERHWHGAAPDSDMTHLSILLPGELTIEEGL